MSIGRPLARPDGREKVTGRALYTADHVVDRMLYGVLVGATIPAGRIESIDTKAAHAERGVVRVITHADMPRLKLAAIPPLASAFLPMQSDEIQYQGQAVAIVLGETLEAAERGAELVEIRYAPSRFAAEQNGFDTEGARLADPKGPYTFGIPTTFEKAIPTARSRPPRSARRRLTSSLRGITTRWRLPQLWRNGTATS